MKVILHKLAHTFCFHGHQSQDSSSLGPTVLPSNPPLSGKALVNQQYLESKQKQEEEKKKKEKKKQWKKDKKTKDKSRKTISYLKEQHWKISI
jgi:hypothetical protein